MNLTTYPFLKQCNGIDCQGSEVMGDLKRQVENVYPLAKATFHDLMKNTPGTEDNTNHKYRYDIGVRCNLDGVLKRLQGFQGKMVLDYEVFDWVMDALRDCASADYYYNFEKEY